MLSVQPDIFEDAKSLSKNDCQTLRDLARRMFTAVSLKDGKKEISKMVNNCMEGFTFFVIRVITILILQFGIADSP